MDNVCERGETDQLGGGFLNAKAAFPGNPGLLNRPPDVPRAASYNRSVTIERQLNGYLVRVGCQTLVFEDVVKLIHELARYLADPAAVEREYLEKFNK